MESSGDTVVHPYGSHLDVTRYVKTVLWKAHLQDDGRQTVHRFIKHRDLGRLIEWIDMHQQDPQLLDVYLHDNIPQLATAYLESLSRHSYVADESNPEYCLLPTAVCKILYVFCKVRGEKVILGLLTNETRYLEPLLLALERASKSETSAAHGWEERYILLLWLSLQLLAPFDLATISSIEPGDDIPNELQLPPSMPGIAKRLVPICLSFLNSSAREQKAAAMLLARLCLRQDMMIFEQFLSSTVEWMFQSLDDIARAATPSIHDALGKLQFLNYLLQFGTNEDVGEFVTDIYHNSVRIFNQEKFQFLQNSAVARKLRLKLMRNVAKQVLAPGFDLLPPDLVVGGFVALLLEIMGDNDSLVRLAASKSLSMITQTLDPSSAAQILSAILEALDENVIWGGRARDFSAVHPLRWHGFTLTLSHLLYRRAIPLDLLPKTLSAIVLSLNFEQRSATGSKIGTNVRDAANFGLWALSRRYTTDELLSIAVSEISKTAVDDGIANVIQYIAVELLKSSCLDPAGNVRRGSSAALQELVGRHPNSVLDPIDLVQNVSYMAVGLPSKAMNAGVQAALLQPVYWHSMFEGLIGWRGIQSPDCAVRELAAQMIGQLGLLKNIPSGFDLYYMLRKLLKTLRRLEPHMAEERHGVRLGIAAAISCIPIDSEDYLPGMSKEMGRLVRDLQSSASRNPFDPYYGVIPVPLVVFILLEIVRYPSHVMPTDRDAYRSADGRPELTAAATLALIGSITTALHTYTDYWNASDMKEFDSLQECFELCIRRTEDSVLAKIDGCMNSLYLCNEGYGLDRRSKLWLSEISQSGAANRHPGLCLALGTAASMGHSSRLLQAVIPYLDILDALKHRCTEEVHIEARVNALDALKHAAERVLEQHEPPPSRPLQPDVAKARKIQTASVLSSILEGAVSGLNDYTINERGDVGSLARISALQVIKVLSPFPFQDVMDAGLSSKIEQVTIALRRMAVEKLDKVRSKVLDINSTTGAFAFLDSAIEGDMQSDARSEEYFALNLSTIGSATLSAAECRSLVHGYCSSAGIGSESVMRAARRGLLLAFENAESAQGFECFVAQMIEILASEGNKDGVSVSVLETLAYLGDAGLISLLHVSDVK
jgi:hypothetical protein